MCSKLNELLSWNGPTVHVCCFMLARASIITFVSRVQRTAKKIFVSRKISQQGHSLAEVSLYTRFVHRVRGFVARSRYGCLCCFTTDWYKGAEQVAHIHATRAYGPSGGNIHALTSARQTEVSGELHAPTFPIHIQQAAWWVPGRYDIPENR